MNAKLMNAKPKRCAAMWCGSLAEKKCYLNVRALGQEHLRSGSLRGGPGSLTIVFTRVTRAVVATALANDRRNVIVT